MGGHFVPVLLFLFITSHAIGRATVIWVLISEIPSTHIRGSGQSFGSSAAAVVPSLVPVLFSTIDPWPSICLLCWYEVLQLIFVMVMMPETKGKILEELLNIIVKSKKHNR
ncbi:MFS transporter [Confluentibacter sediminis]|uniref:MFS transporter n=1 Tax=Confluentibacter sediminis TaxID=2219045 RepID=UPI001F3D209B|nr:MFS transporter [Confluentibacter sediminis]